MNPEYLNDETISRLFHAIDEVSPQQPLDDSQHPLTLLDGVYLLGEKLGQGGMASIYKAQVDLNRFDFTILYAYTQVSGKNHKERRDKAELLAHELTHQSNDRATILNLIQAQSLPMPNPFVAIKVAMGHIDLLRFEAEWKNLLCLKHPNLIQVYGGGVYQHRPYYAMELLENIIPTETILSCYNIKDKLNIIIQAAKGVEHLHQAGIIHRDIKPSNFITYKDKSDSICTKVTDLGIAKDTDLSLEMTQSGAVLGSPYYMSPEQISSSRDVDQRSDIYSLGASLYEFISGQKPYQEKNTVFEVISAISLGQTPKPIQEIIPNLSEVLSHVIQCSMQLHPQKRYDNVNEFIHDLEHYLTIEEQSVLNSKTYELSSATSPKPYQHESFHYHSRQNKSFHSFQDSTPQIKKSTFKKQRIWIISLLCSFIVALIALNFISDQSQLSQTIEEVIDQNYKFKVSEEINIDWNLNTTDKITYHITPSNQISSKSIRFILPKLKVEDLSSTHEKFVAYELEEQNNDLILSLQLKSGLEKNETLPLTIISSSNKRVKKVGQKYHFNYEYISQYSTDFSLTLTFPKNSKLLFIHPNYKKQSNDDLIHKLTIKKPLQSHEALESFITFSKQL